MSARKTSKTPTAGKGRSAPASKVAPPRDAAPHWLWPVLIAVTALAYQPAWHGGILWDDDGHLTRPMLQSASGLWRIWFDVHATQQYYPVVHSTFWALHWIWGDATTGYHLLNIGLHATSAFLVARLLRRLAIPGGTLAAVVFALHPVQAESVAWITELKNTLSGVLYLGAALTYLRFDVSRNWQTYAAATLLFVAALLSKSVTATLPAALLVIFWWQRGKIDWRRDVAPLAPWVALGLGAGLFTAWIERTLIGAQGSDFTFTFVERVLIAGRAIWFYLASLLWPANLMFNYPRWSVSQSVWWQYLFPLGVIALLVVAWRFRTRSRAPLAALLFFAGTLFPALGFFNVYPFRYALVADHFQYLASLGVIVLLSAAATTLLVARPAALGGPRSPRAFESATPLLLLIPIAALLGTLTWREARQYADAETLYRTTLERNPDSWLAHNNLAVLKVHGSAADRAEATAHIKEALRLNPSDAEAHNNLGLALRMSGQPAAAVDEQREAIRLKPDLAEPYYNLGLDFQDLNRLPEAELAYHEALRINPTYIEAHHNLANVLIGLNRFDEAIVELRAALAIRADLVDTRKNLGDVFQRLGRNDEAIAEYERVLRDHPENAEVQNNLALALQKQGRLEDAITHLRTSAQLMPQSSRIRDSLGRALVAAGRPTEAVTEFEQGLAVESGPAAAAIHNDLGITLTGLGRYPEAATHFAEAVRLRPDFAEARANLAKALARSR